MWYSMLEKKNKNLVSTICMRLQEGPWARGRDPADHPLNGLPSDAPYATCYHETLGSPILGSRGLQAGGSATMPVTQAG